MPEQRLGRERAAEAADAADDLGAVGALDGALSWATARLPSSMSTPAAAYDAQPGAGRPPADVAADLHAVERDARHRRVGGVAGRGEVGAEPGDGEDPPAGGATVGEPGREHAGRRPRSTSSDAA